MTGIDALAEEYWAHYLEVEPTNAHLIGEYGGAGRFEEASREAEDREIAAMREFAQRAEALDETGLDAQQRITRAVLISDARSRADLMEARLNELGADPIFGLQVSMPIIVGMLALPDPDVAEALVEKFRAVGRCYRELAERQREGVASGRLPAAFAVEETVAQLDGLLAKPVADDRCWSPRPHLEGSTPTPGRSGCAGWSSPTYARAWRPPATCCATRCCR